MTTLVAFDLLKANRSDLIVSAFAIPSRVSVSHSVLLLPAQCLMPVCDCMLLEYRGSLAFLGFGCNVSGPHVGGWGSSMLTILGRCLVYLMNIRAAYSVLLLLNVQRVIGFPVELHSVLGASLG